MTQESEQISTPAPTWLDLYDYRQRMAALYRERVAALHAGADAATACQQFRQQKDALFATHPQSSFDVEARAAFTGLHYFPYDAAYCVEAIMTPLAEDNTTVEAATTKAIPHRRAAMLTFTLAEMPLHLTVYWLDVYGGSLFLPFRDTTCPTESYGAGRYLFDTVKGSDFLRLDGNEVIAGYAGGHVQLDFNYAYNPSCAYDERWACPLAPRENWLPVAIPVGERKYHP